MISPDNRPQLLRCGFLAGLLLATLATEPQAAETVMDQRIESLLSQMTLEEKASLTSGRDNWSTQPIERLGIPFIWVAPR